MKIGKCLSISSFKKRIEKLACSNSNEWQGREVTFGDTKISLPNLVLFLKNNHHFWLNSANPTLADGVRKLASRVKQELHCPLLADLLEHNADSMKFPSSIINMIRGRFTVRSNKVLSAYKQFCKVTAQTNSVSKTWNNCSFSAQVEWINFNKVPLRKVLRCRMEIGIVISFIIECGARLEHLDLTEFEGISHTQLHAIIKACPNLRSITLYANAYEDLITNKSLEDLIEAYPKLESLSLLNMRGITELPKLPETLKSLSLDNLSNLSKLPEILPKDLVSFDIRNLPLISKLPPLSNNLNRLRICYCSISKEDLPNPLPIGLRSLSLELLEVDSLPNFFPKDLEHLYLFGNHYLRELPPLPENLLSLYINEYRLGLPVLPAKLKKLTLVNSVVIDELPENWPKNLESISLFHMEAIKKIKSIPQNLKYWKMEYMKGLRKIPKIITAPLETFKLAFVKLEKLPFSLPNALRNISWNGLSRVKYLPVIPSGVTQLRLKNFAQITHLPPLSEALQKLLLCDLSLQSLPVLPSSLISVSLDTIRELLKLSKLPENLQNFEFSRAPIVEISEEWPEKLASISIGSLQKLKKISHPFPPSLEQLALFYLPLLEKLPEPLFLGKKPRISQCSKIKLPAILPIKT